MDGRMPTSKLDVNDLFCLIEASIERIKVSKASSELMRYCGEQAKNDPLLMGNPASETLSRTRRLAQFCREIPELLLLMLNPMC
uniref:Guanine nucleotide-binding protein subunit gamma n=1 Tax=Pundamilia nyererei TaxID=303518 RepID=A0A3B4H330_9CICH